MLEIAVDGKVLSGRTLPRKVRDVHVCLSESRFHTYHSVEVCYSQFPNSQWKDMSPKGNLPTGKSYPSQNCRAALHRSERA